MQKWFIKCLFSLRISRFFHIRRIFQTFSKLKIWGSIRARENFIFKSLRIESIKYCFKSPPPKFQPQIRSKIAHSTKKVKQGFHRFIWRIKKLLISLNSKGMFDHSTLKCRFFKCYEHRLKWIWWSDPNYEEFKKSFKKSPPNISPHSNLPLDFWGGEFWRDIRWTFFFKGFFRISRKLDQIIKFIWDDANNI